MTDIYSQRAKIRQAELKYLSEMLPQLRNMAANLDESLLAKLIEMAALEAELKYTLEAEYAESEDAGSLKTQDCEQVRLLARH